MPIQPAKPTLKPGALLAGKYRLLKMLGRGAAGVVWSAVNTATSRKVALKLLLNPAPKQRERLLREARAAGALSHPNVIDIYDVTQAADGNPVLVLELLEGETLQQLIDERAPLPPLEAAGIARDVARALAVAHASGIVHRDLKPANIFMHQPGDDPPVVKVVDFGISKNLLTGEGTLTETGMAVGSPAFMSPEQVRGERSLDGRTDLWALGVILYEMLAGKRLFDGRTHEVLTQVLVEPIKPIDSLAPGIEPALAAVVHSLLERDLDKRLSSAEEAAERLAVVVGGVKESPLRRSVAAPALAEPHDTTVVPHPMPEVKVPPVPKAYLDDEEEEPTHVAPFAMRAALAQQTVPSVYEDDDEDDDQTKVAPDAVLTAAIRASRSNEVAPDSSVATVRPPAPEEPRRDENAVPTVRPPSMEIPAMAEPSPASVKTPAAPPVKTPVPVTARASSPTAAKASSPTPKRAIVPPPRKSNPTAAKPVIVPPPRKSSPTAAKPAAPLAVKVPRVAEVAERPSEPGRPAKPEAAQPAEPAKAEPVRPVKAESVRPVKAESVRPAKAEAASAAQPPSTEVDLVKLFSERPPPAADAGPPSGDLFHLSGGASATAPAAAEGERSPVPAPASETAPEVPAPQGRNKLMIVGAVLFLVLAVVIFLTQLR